MRSARALALLVVGAALSAQVAQNSPETVIRTTTRLVQVRVMAEDSKGAPVTDFRKEEFQLQDNRKPQPIAFLTAEGSAQLAAVPDAQSSIPGSPEEVRDEYAIIMLDWLNPGAADRLVVRSKVNKLLWNFQPRQKLALYVMGRDSRLLHDFTSDRGELLQALANTEEEPENLFDPSRPRGEDPRYKTWLTLSVQDRIAAFNGKILDTISVLQKVAEQLDHVPGRKSLIWVTNGFPIVLDSFAVPGSKEAETSYRAHVEPLIAKFNRANVAVYTVDARGLQAAPPTPDLSRLLNPSYGDVGTLQEFSSRTGGTTFTNQNDLDEGMRLALEDSKVSYTLGFIVPANAMPGWHEINLRTTRTGVKLRYRGGYRLDDVAPPSVRRRI